MKMYYGDSSSEAVTTDLTKLKMGYEFGRWLARFTLAYEDRERGDNSPTNYLCDPSGNPVWSGTYVMGGDRFTINAGHFAVSQQNRETLLMGAGLEGALNNNGSLDTNVSVFDILDDTTLSSNVNPAASTFDGSGRVKQYIVVWPALLLIYTVACNKTQHGLFFSFKMNRNCGHKFFSPRYLLTIMSS